MQQIKKRHRRLKQTNTIKRLFRRKGKIAQDETPPAA